MGAVRKDQANTVLCRVTGNVKMAGRDLAAIPSTHVWFSLFKAGTHATHHGLELTK